MTLSKGILVELWVFARLELIVEPGAGVIPVSLGRGFRKAESLASFRDAEADIVSEFDEFRFGRILHRQFGKCFIYRQEALILGLDGQINTIQIHPHQSFAMANAALSARVVNEDSAHRFGRSRKKVPAVPPGLLLRSGKAQPGLMHQRGGLKCLSRHLLSHPRSR